MLLRFKENGKTVDLNDFSGNNYIQNNSSNQNDILSRKLNYQKSVDTNQHLLIEVY